MCIYVFSSFILNSFVTKCTTMHYIITVALFPILRSKMYLCGSVHSWCNRSLDLSFMVDLLSHLSFQPVLHSWCNKGCSIYCPDCGMVHIKDTLLLIEIVHEVGFLSRYLNDPLPYVQYNITIHKMC